MVHACEKSYQRSENETNSGVCFFNNWTSLKRRIYQLGTRAVTIYRMSLHVCHDIKESRHDMTQAKSTSIFLKQCVFA